MRRSGLALAVTVGLGIAQSARAATTLIDFEDLAPGTAASEQYLARGVIFSTASGPPRIQNPTAGSTWSRTTPWETRSRYSSEGGTGASRRNVASPQDEGRGASPPPTRRALPFG